MSLIEQLGGYERAKAFLNATSFTIDELIMMQRSGLRTQHVDKALLEYRRQYNIFEVGDIAVNRRGEESRLLKIWRVDICRADKRMSIADYDADGLSGWSRFHCLRHATDAEIQAGKRLEAKE